MRKIGLVIILGIILSACTHQQPQSNLNINMNNQPTAVPTPEPVGREELAPVATQSAKRAVLRTTMGDITVELYAAKAPITVANFAALSEGTIDWIDPVTKQVQTDKRYYRNIVFHRIIKNFMIQGGDQTGTGRGGPGYQFRDEFDDSLVFDQAGILAMANSGPNTNGSQFFITTVATPWLNGKHTIFGKVVEGMEVVRKIEAVTTDANDKPVTDVVLREIIIER